MSWPLVKLGEVIQFIRGVTFKPEEVVAPFSDDSIVVMRTKNVQVLGLDTGDLIAIPKKLVKRQEQVLLAGDLLLSSANSWELVGKSSYVEKLDYESTAGGFISIVRPIQNKIHSRYLYHWITNPSMQHKIRHLGRKTTNISNLNVDRFKQLEIPLPPLDEQKRIAAILDKADAIRRKRQQGINLADDFLRSVFLDMFGDPNTYDERWCICTIGDLGGNENNRRVPLKQADRDLRDGEFPYYGATGVIDHIDDYVYDGQYLLIAEDGKNLINRSKPLAFPANGKFWVNNHAHVLSDTGKVNLIYLEYFLNLKDIRSHVTGIDQFKLNRTSLDRIKIHNPPIELQQHFDSIVTKTKSTQSKAILALSDSENNFRALSQKAFAGEL